MNVTKYTVLILGGAGFIGSNLAQKFYNAGHKIIVIDGLVEKTGGRRENLKSILSDIQFINAKVECVPNLEDIISASDIIVDSIGWTSHNLAFKNPIYDLRLNVESHLHFLESLKNIHGKKIIYLGSRGQYGQHGQVEITEDTGMIPTDIQGIHKVAAESYYRVYSALYGLNIISLRFSNCFGENQPLKGDDIGLVGGFIRDILSNKPVVVFGHNRYRYLIYVKDLSEIVLKLSMRKFEGFVAFNLGGQKILIEDLIKMLIRITGKGIFTRKEAVPNVLRLMDSGICHFSDKKLKTSLGGFTNTRLSIALGNTVSYFRENL